MGDRKRMGEREMDGQEQEGRLEKLVDARRQGGGVEDWLGRYKYMAKLPAGKFFGVKKIWKVKKKPQRPFLATLVKVARVAECLYGCPDAGKNSASVKSKRGIPDPAWELKAEIWSRDFLREELQVS